RRRSGWCRSRSTASRSCRSPSDHRHGPTPFCQTGAFMGSGLVELLLPGGADGRAFLATLSAHLDVAGRASPRTDRTHLDTSDGRVHAKGWRLYTDGAGAAMTLVDPSNGRVAAGEGHDRVTRVVEPRVLLPQVRVKATSHVMNVLNGDRKTVARIELVEPVV